MKLVALSDRDRRSVVSGAWVMAALLVGFKAAPLWIRWRTQTLGDAEQAVSRAHGTRVVIGRLPTTIAELEARMAAMTELRSGLIVAVDSASVAQAMFGFLAEAARISAVRIDSARVNAQPFETDQLRRITLDAVLTADVRGLTALGATLQSSAMLFAVRRLTVTSPAAEVAPQTEPEQLSIRLTVDGLALITTSRGEP